jgi:hypothetical protein
VRRTLRTIATALLLVGSTHACFDLEPPIEPTPSVSNTCSEDGDCSTGSCRVGVCTARSTELQALLLELTPPSTQERFRGARTYYPLKVNTNHGGDNEVTIVYPRTVRGDISLAFGAADCRPSPVDVSFVPVETHLGLDAARYTTVSEVGTTIIDKKHVDTHRFSLSGIPEGIYDVYLEDARLVDNSGRPECEVAPQSIRRLRIGSNESVSKYVSNLTQGEARSLRVVVPWSEQFEGWEVDVIHPVTQERLSSRGTLSAPADGATSADVRLRLSKVLGKDVTGSNQELLRFTPPNGTTAPTITMVLAGLEVFERGEALVPELGQLASPVKYQVWVWRSPQGGKVEGSVQFSAVSLESIPPGVNATFERRATIGTGGLVDVDLPPGKYRARVTPNAGTERAPQEAEITVWLPTAGVGETQGGHVIVVPEASTVHGVVRFGRSLPPTGTQVIATGIDAWPLSFLPPAGDPFLPGGSTLVVGEEFSIGGLSCRGCEGGSSGALYNVEIRPSERSGLPWVIAVGEHVAERDVMLSDRTIDMPFVWSGKLAIDTSVGPIPLPRFSVRVFALLGKDGSPLQEVDLPRCNELSSSEVETLPCVARALEVASTRTSDDGALTLLIPQHLDAAPTLDGGL